MRVLRNRLYRIERRRRIIGGLILAILLCLICALSVALLRRSRGIGPALAPAPISQR